MANEVKYQGLNGEERTATIHSLTGTVEELKEFNTTEISGSGGGTSTYIDNHRIQTNSNPINISSTNTRNLTFFLKDQQNKEHHIKLTGWENLAIREGHKIKLVWIRDEERQESTPYCMVHNISMQMYYWQANKLDGFLGKKKTTEKNLTKIGFRNIAILVVVAILLFFIFIIPVFTRPGGMSSFLSSSMICMVTMAILWVSLGLMGKASAEQVYTDYYAKRKDVLNQIENYLNNQK